jgi:hypothetical protein
MSACERESEAEEWLAGALPGVELQHELSLSLRDWTAWSETSRRLLDAGAELVGVQISRQGERLQGRCRIKAISASAARRIAAKLSSEGLAEHASVEHLMLSKPAGRTP